MIGTKPFTQIIYRHVFKKTLELHIPKWDLLPMLNMNNLKTGPVIIYIYFQQECQVKND